MEVQFVSGCYELWNLRVPHTLAVDDGHPKGRRRGSELFGEKNGKRVALGCSVAKDHEASEEELAERTLHEPPEAGGVLKALRA